jgi:hypothetical protein
VREASADVFMQSFFLPIGTLQIAVEERKSPATMADCPEPNSMLCEIRSPAADFPSKKRNIFEKVSLSK